jgi:hypothetical protein
MQLMTSALAARFAAIGRQDVADPIVIAKYFVPSGPQTWWATEYDPADRLFFGYAQLGLGSVCDEWGSFALAELEAVRAPLVLRLPSGKGTLAYIEVERDRYFTERPISELVPEAVRR